jgi:hypothetical protein
MQNFCMLDMVCALNPCPRPRFFLHHTRHSAKMRIWWPVTSHQVPLFALSGGIWAAKSTATKPPTRPMIERTRTWSQPNHPPAVLDNFGGGPGRPNSQSPRGPRHDVERKLDKPKPANSGAQAAYPLGPSGPSAADHPTHAEIDSLLHPPKRTEAANAAPVSPCLCCLGPIAKCPMPHQKATPALAGVTRNHFIAARRLRTITPAPIRPAMPIHAPAGSGTMIV